jgi:hypothetical protein
VLALPRFVCICPPEQLPYTQKAIHTFVTRQLLTNYTVEQSLLLPLFGVIKVEMVKTTIK